MDAKIVMSLARQRKTFLKTQNQPYCFNTIYRTFRIKQFLKSKQETPVSQFHHNRSFKQAPTPQMHINLPKINIKSFGCFSAAIHKNLELVMLKKLNYLNGMLKGEAARAISGLPLTEENHRKATELDRLRVALRQEIETVVSQVQIL